MPNEPMRPHIRPMYVPFLFRFTRSVHMCISIHAYAKAFAHQSRSFFLSPIYMHIDTCIAHSPHFLAYLPSSIYRMLLFFCRVASSSTVLVQFGQHQGAHASISCVDQVCLLVSFLSCCLRGPLFPCVLLCFVLVCCVLHVQPQSEVRLTFAYPCMLHDVFCVCSLYTKFIRTFGPFVQKRDTRKHDVSLNARTCTLLLFDAACISFHCVLFSSLLFSCPFVSHSRATLLPSTFYISSRYAHTHFPCSVARQWWKRPGR